MKLRALAAKKICAEETQLKDRAYEAGRLMGYLEVISLPQQNAVGLGIRLADLRLDAIDPERDLL